MIAPILLTPGPVAVPDFVMQAVSQPTMQHRSQAFERFYGGLLEKLKYFFQTSQTTLGMIANGSMGMEALITSLFRPKEKVIVASLGKFSQRWVAYAQLIGLEVVEISVEWGKTISVAQILESLANHPDTTGLILTHCETSTGALLDVEEMNFAAKQAHPQLITVVDTISSVGALPFYFDVWKVDAAVVASQKALMNPTGTCYFALSEAAVARLQPSDAGDAFNLYNYYRAALQHSYPYSPPVQLFYGVDCVLDYVLKKELPVIWNETLHASRTFKQFVKANQGQIWGELPSDSLTAFSFPLQNMRDLKQKCIEKGVEMSGGQDLLKGKIMRIAHLGLYDTGVTEKAITALASLL